MSVVFQLIIRKTVHLWTALGFGLLFITLPYAVARALANRLASRLARRSRRIDTAGLSPTRRG
jgi:lauroyl/myristoyl acyltransferase